MTARHEHGSHCTPMCNEVAVPSPLNRQRSFLWVDCPWCGAEAGKDCTVGVSGKARRRRLSEPHPARKQVAA